jgi:hypothetical protein
MALQGPVMNSKLTWSPNIASDWEWAVPPARLSFSELGIFDKHPKPKISFKRFSTTITRVNDFAYAT